MKKHVSLAVCVLAVVAMVFSLVACNATAHEHTFSDKWSYNETNHWHAATCTDTGCGSAKGADNAHADSDKNKVCDVCGYDYNHEHTFSEEVSSDSTTHWYAVSCGCSIDTNKDPHVDTNNDGACDLCKYDGGHEHVINENSYSYDANAHWNTVECGHSVEEKEAHELNEVGICDVCGYMEGGIDVESAVALGDYYRDLVNGATIVNTSDTWGSITEAYAEYVLGNQSSHVTTNAWDEITNYWYMLYNGTIFAVQVDSWGDVFSPYDPSSALVNGYEFADIFGYEGGDDTRSYYGANDLVAGLYELAMSYGAYEYVMVLDGTTYYNFDFDYPVSVFDYELEENVYQIYTVSVSFSLSDSYTYDEIYVSSAKYDAEAVYSEDEEPVLLGVYASTMLTSTIREYAIVQTVGARELEFAYDPEELLMSEYTLFDSLGNPVEESITLEAGAMEFLNFGGILPETAVIGLNNIDAVSDTLSVNYWDGSVTVMAGAPGEYTFDVIVNGTTTTYNVTVTQPPVTELTVYYNDSPVNSGVINTYANPGQILYVTFSVEANAYADNSVTCQIPRMYMSSASITDNGDGTFTLMAMPDMGGYVQPIPVLITSTVNPDVSVELQISATPAPAISDVLNGTYVGEIMDYGFNEYGMTNLEVTFTPSAEGATSGTFTFHVYYSAMWSEGDFTDVYTYNYDADTDEFTVELVSSTFDDVNGMPLFVDLNTSSYSVTVTNRFGSTATLTPGTTSGGNGGAATLDVAGDYVCNMYTNEEDATGLYAGYLITLNADGTGTFKYRTFAGRWTDVYVTEITWVESTETPGAIVITPADSEYLQVGTYTVGTYEEGAGFIKDGIEGVVILEGTTPKTFNFVLN